MSWLTKFLSKPEIQVGDVWVMDEKNPFEHPCRVKILDYKKGYVLYLVVEQEGRDVAYCAFHRSKSEGDFRLIYRKE
jgi:hypothetical protein